MGRTGIEACQLGFGGIPIQKVDEKQAVETVLHAVEKGIDFIDTSRLYTTSESRIGKALQQTDKKVILASKSFQKTSDGIRKDIDISLKELQKEFIDLYQCHFVMNEMDYEGIISSKGALDGMLKAKEEGLIGHIGITSHSLDLLERVIEEGKFDTIMACYSFLEPAAIERVIPKAIQKNIGVIAMKSLSGGVIQNPTLALKYVLAQPDIMIIPGVEHKDLVDENWQIFQESHALSTDEKEEIRAIQKQFDKTFCRRCDYCLPCSEGILVQVMLGMKPMVLKEGFHTLKSPLILDVIDKARNCTDCGECMEKCPYDLPIPDLIKESLAWVEKHL